MRGESVVAWAIRISVREPGISSSLVLRDICGAARLAAAAGNHGCAAPGWAGRVGERTARPGDGLGRGRRGDRAGQLTRAIGAADYRRAQMCLQCRAARSILR